MARRRPKAKASIELAECRVIAPQHIYFLFIYHVRCAWWCHETLADVSMFIIEIGFIVYRIACYVFYAIARRKRVLWRSEMLSGMWKAKYSFSRRAPTKNKIRSKQSFMCVLASHAKRARVSRIFFHLTPNAERLVQFLVQTNNYALHDTDQMRCVSERRRKK